MSRRTGKAGGDKPTDNAGLNLQQELKNSIAEPLGEQMADAITAHALMTMAKTMETGKFGPVTTKLLESLKQGAASPFRDWMTEIEDWLMPPALPAAAELDG